MGKIGDADDRMLLERQTIALERQGFALEQIADAVSLIAVKETTPRFGRKRASGLSLGQRLADRMGDRDQQMERFR